jgi:hypothetical protein
MTVGMQLGSNGPAIRGVERLRTNRGRSVRVGFSRRQGSSSVTRGDGGMRVGGVSGSWLGCGWVASNPSRPCLGSERGVEKS